MPRLSAEEWTAARAEYEVNGKSMREVAKMFGVTEGAVRKMSSKYAWEQKKYAPIVSDKIAAVKAMHDVEMRCTQLSTQERKAVDRGVRNALEIEGLRNTFHAELYEMGRHLLRTVASPNEWKTLTSGARDLMPQKETTTTVNVAQQTVTQQQSPEEVCQELIAEQEREIASEAGPSAQSPKR